MKKMDFMDFSIGSDFQNRLLQRIKAECFGALEDDDLEFINAAGDPSVNAAKGLGIPDFNNRPGKQ